MAIRHFLVVAFLIVSTITAYAQSQQPSPSDTVEKTIGSAQKQQTPSTLLDTTNKQDNSKKNRFLSGIQESAHNGNNKPADDATKKQTKGEHEWTRSDIIAIVAVISAFLQFIALCVTIIVMVRGNRRELRAYVFFDSGTLTDGSMLDPPIPIKKDVPGAVMFLKNSGQTPAYEVASSVRMDIQPLNNPVLQSPKVDQVFSTNIGPSGVITKSIWFGRPLSPIEIEGVKKGDLAIYLNGRIEYRDAFKKRRFTTFRLYYSGPFPPLPGTVFNFCVTGNDAT